MDYTRSGPLSLSRIAQHHIDMDSRRRRIYRRHNELIFSYANRVETDNLQKSDDTNNNVDLEIILLGPKSKRFHKTRAGGRQDKSLRLDSSGSSESEEDLIDFDSSKLNQKPQVGATDEPSEGTSSSQNEDSTLTGQGKASDKDASKNAEKKGREQNPKVNSGISDRLLDRMERRFRASKGLEADDGVYIDYMDYF